MVFNYGICSVCMSRLAVMKLKGFIYKHRGRLTGICPGSGKLPYGVVKKESIT